MEPYEYPCWNDKPPVDFPFKRNLLGYTKEPNFKQKKPATISDLKEVSERGSVLLESEEYIDALWKFENCLFICEQNQSLSPQEIVKYASNCVEAATIIFGKSLDLVKPLDMYCKPCFETVPQGSCLLEEPHYWRGESLRLQGKTREALHHYQASYRFTHNAPALSKIILLKAGDKAKELLKEFNFQKNLTKLFQLLPLGNSKELSHTQMECLIKFSKQVDLKKFSNAAKAIPCEVGERLLRFCQEKQQLLQEVVDLLSYSEDQMVEIIIKDEKKKDRFFSHLLDTKRFSYSEKLMKKLSASCRSQYLCTVLRSGEEDRAMLLLDSGEIEPESIDLSKQTKKILHSKGLLLKLLSNKVNPCGLSESTTPVIQLVQSCPKQGTKNVKSVVENVILLINTGANIEDLSAYHTFQTTPLHVATEIALRTEDIDILRIVYAKWKGNSSLTDKRGKTVLHIVAQASKSPSYTQTLWEYLVCTCKVSITVPDDDNQVAAHYLSHQVKKQLNKKKIPYEIAEKLQPSSKKEQPISMTLPSHEEHIQPARPEEISASGMEEVQQSAGDDNEQEEAQTSAPFVEYTEKEVKKMIKRLFTKPDTYFLDEPENDTINKPGQNNESAAARSSTDVKRVEKSLPFNPDSADTIWEVEVSEHFIKQLREESVFPKTVITTIRKLAEGYFDYNIMKKLKSKCSSPLIFEARVNDSVRLLYTLLDRFSEKDTARVRAHLNKSVHVYKKTIIILDIVKHHHISHSAERAVKAIGNEKEKLAVLEGEGKLNGRLIPQISLRCECKKLTDEERKKIRKLLNTSAELSEGRKVEHIGAIMYSLTIPIVLGLLDEKNEKGDYPIKVTDDEFDIIEKSSKQPVVVLGRSGTGKTTVCLCRLWKVFTAYWDSRDRLQVPQIPKGRYLKAEEMKEGASLATLDLNMSSDGPKSTCADSDEDILIVDNGCEHIHQVFITKSSKLCEQMKQRFYDFVAKYGNAQKHREYINSQKQMLSEIDELCFPLFLTARQFFLMLDKSLGDNQEYFQADETIISSEQPTISKLETLHEIWKQEQKKIDEKEQLKRVEVTASYFQTNIWPKIEKHTKDKIDPFLVWMEIQSFIKGSLQALESKGGTLSKDAYEEFGKKRAPNFPMSRAEVYRIFEAYTHYLKHKDIGKRLFDNGDFIFKLYTRLLQTIHSQDWSIHYVYIDEVQDFTQAELAVITRCCRHPNGFFFAGDTAQTIIKGIAFRFEDLVSIFHLLGKEFEKEKFKPVVNTPERSLLTLNHRSHSGITSLATTVTDLLKYFFEEAFDWRNIPKDESSVGDGPRPLFLCYETLNDSFTKLKSGSKESIQFGANQVVIVRDTEHIGELPSSLKEAIVLTVQQCKGLEFNDVLLYNFFTNFIKECTKTVKEIWRASATYLDKKQTVNPSYTQKEVHLLKFDERRHKTLCAELKYLYTVITRAKSHLWIYESSPPDTLPMLEYWHRRDVVDVVTDPESSIINDQLREVSQSISTKADWKRRGDELSELELWERARECYQKANEPLLEKKVSIQILQRKAHHAQRELYVTMQRKAAVMHLDCDKIQHDVKYLKSAAVCLRLAEMYLTSAKLLEKLHEYTGALEIYDTLLHDVDNYTRLKEELGAYKDAIAYACDQKEFKKGRDLTMRFEREEKLEQPDLKKFVTECIIDKMIRRGIKKEVREWLQFIPDEEEQLCILKKAELHNDVFSKLRSKKRYNEVFRYAKAHSMFTAATKLAKEQGNNILVIEFELQQATEEILTSGTISTQSLKQSISCLTQDKDLYTAAKASLLLAKDGEKSEEEAIKLCIQACDIYKKKKNKVGEVECFYTLSIRDPITDPHLLIPRTVEMVRKVEELLNFLGRKSAESDIVAFYEIEVLEEMNGDRSLKYYCMPTKPYLWIGKHVKALKKLLDIDGMLKLEQVKLIKAVKTHFTSYKAEWLDTAKGSLTASLDQEFPFHKKMLKEKTFLQPSEHLSQEYNIGRYMELCKLELLLYKVDEEMGNPADTLLCLLSPFSQLIIHLTKEDCIKISSTNLCQALRKKIEKTMHSATCNEWLVAWQILSITGNNRILASNIKELTESVNKEDKKQENPYQFRKDKALKKYRRCSEWLQSCELLKQGVKALTAIENSLQHFIQFAIDINEPISIENTVAVLSVHTTALLSMLSYSNQREHQRIIPVPETFERFMNTFDLTNCHGEAGIGVSKACLETAKEMEADTLQQKVIDLLKGFLSLLTGKFNDSFYPIEQVFRQPQIHLGEALHCLILTLTILGNLSMMCDPTLNSFTQLQLAYEEVKQCLNPEKISQFSENVPEIFKNAYKRLLECKSTKDIFEKVVSELLTKSFGMTMKQLEVVKQKDSEQIVFRQCHCQEIPPIPI